ncbi:MAG: glycosyltransferase [Ferruginibacter sp.]
MLNKKVNKISKKNRVLLVPLDWGLGHATRCIPLIKELQELGCEVIVGAEKSVKSLLQHEFQQLIFIDLPGYRIRYSKTSYWLPLKIMVQIPGIIFNITREHFWLKKVKKKFKIDAIISDNRFGLYLKATPTVYITHQLLIKTGSHFTEKIAQKIHYWFIKKYTYCWVPDFEEQPNLAGELSCPKKLPGNTSFIGCLSRFEKQPLTIKKEGILLLLSGPEPQRTIFENILLSQLNTYDGKILFVRGLPGKDEKLPEPGCCDNVTIKNHLPADQLNDAINAAEWVICRSGYTTIMDLVKLGQKAILIPTPGQTEQEYLADYLMKEKFFFAAKQDKFVLKDAIEMAGKFNFYIPSFNMNQYKKEVKLFVESI